MAAGLGYFWLKPAAPPKVYAERSLPIFEHTKTDLRGQTLQNALTKIVYPQSVLNDHLGDVWVVYLGAAPSRTLIPIPEDTDAWTVVAACFRVQTLGEEAANRKLSPGQKPSINFVSFGIQRSNTIPPEQLGATIRDNLDDTLPGCIGPSGMNAYRPGTGPPSESNRSDTEWRTTRLSDSLCRSGSRGLFLPPIRIRSASFGRRPGPVGGIRLNHRTDRAGPCTGRY
ncbi:hypothetical protein F5X71_09915 [Nocardia brasiliensis]|uniref:Uncharacterized protein n=1 Tax=Nocardia brasiliensis TaxID=37326 RepID=A0A6G9XP20_NOCBR|nr:hypothetical protein [Nocardia brasiliensis]QIS02593.1 hypothetical protein F5X71_09915 [Nocardia brasiliensis]